VNTKRNIDYWGIVTRSVRIAWNNKFLWFFGFFAGSGWGGGQVGYNPHGERIVGQVQDFFVAHLELLVAFIVGMVFLTLVLAVLAVISKGAIVSCISRADRGERIRLEEGWDMGVKRFWGVLGIGLLGVLAFLVVTAVCVLAVVVPVVGGAPGIAIAVLIGALLFVPYVAFLFLLAFTVIYAERHYIIAGVPAMDAIGIGWEMTRTYFLQSLLMWLVSLVSAIVFSIALLIVLFIIAVPFILIGAANLVAGLVLGIPVGLVVVIVASSAYSTFDHALWTLLYDDLRGGPAAPATAPAGAGPPARVDSRPPAVLPADGGTPSDGAGDGTSPEPIEMGPPDDMPVSTEPIELGPPDDMPARTEPIELGPPGEAPSEREGTEPGRTESGGAGPKATESGGEPEGRENDGGQ
jgi:hypothetical protein